MAGRNSLFKLELLLLCVIYKSDCYGYEITKTISENTFGAINLKEGVLYPILYKLLENNYISSYERQVGRKIRVYYHIEESGKERVFEMIREYHKMKESIDNLIMNQVGDIK